MEHLIDKVKCINGTEVHISTNMTSDMGLETVVFPCSDNGVDFSRELDYDCYSSIEEAKIGHQKMVNKWKA